MATDSQDIQRMLFGIESMPTPFISKISIKNIEQTALGIKFISLMSKDDIDNDNNPADTDFNHLCWRVEREPGTSTYTVYTYEENQVGKREDKTWIDNIQALELQSVFAKSLEEHMLNNTPSVGLLKI